jgi:hypothetical protein
VGAAIDGSADQVACEAALVHAHATRNRAELLAGELCGCYHCLRLFSPEALGEDDWCDERDGEPTALCPYCGVDAVIGSGSGMELTGEALARLHSVWFAPV